MTNTIRPKLVLSQARAALDWYGVLAAQVGEVHADGANVVHADIVVHGTHLSVKDADGTDPVPQPGPILEMLVDDPDAVEATMLNAGGESIFPVADQPYGARAGRVRDPFGVQWLLTTPVET